MSAVCVCLISVLFLFCTTRAETVENNNVIWKQVGGSVSIQCRTSEQGLTYMILLKGLRKEFEVLYMTSSKNTIAEEFLGRLRVEGALPNVDVVISNFTSEDTGPYWCAYEGFDYQTSERKQVEGNGSMLLVIIDEKQCAKPNKSLLLVTVVVSAAVLFGVFIAFLLWIILKIKQWHAKYGAWHGATSDVYEDMRATMRS